MNRAATFVILAILILASAGVYFQTLSFEFAGDDQGQIQMAQSRFTWDQVPGYFATDVWSYTQRQSSNYYRPVFLVWLMLNYQAFGLSPAGWHATTVGIHVVVTLLLFFLAKRLSGDAALAGIGALWFGVHPVHLEGVAWVSGVTEPLFASLALGTILCYIRAQGGGLEPARSFSSAVDGEAEVSRGLKPAPQNQRFLWRSAAVLLFALAIFAKETAVIVPLILFAYHWLFVKGKKPLREGLLSIVPYLQLLVVYIGARVVALGTFARSAAHWPFRVLVYTIPSAVCFYVRELFWPVRTALFHDVYPIVSWRDFVIPALLCAAIAIALIWIWRRGGSNAFFAALLVVPLLPVLRISVFQPIDFVHDRYLYLPSAGFCLLLAATVRRLPFPVLQMAMTAALAIGAGYVTMRDAPSWKSEESLTRRSLENAPRNIIAQQEYIGMLVVRERYAEAEPMLTKQLAVDPKEEGLLYARAVCYIKLARWMDAKRDLELILQNDPVYPHAHLLLGMAQMELGDMDSGEAEMRRAIELRPRVSAQYSAYHQTLGELLERKGDLQGALREYERELEEFPDSRSAFEHASAIRERMRN